MLKTQNPAVLKISKVISDFFNPLTSLLIFFIYYSIKHYTWQEAIHKFLPILLILLLPVSGWIIWNVKTGKYTNMDVSNRVQRKSLYNFIGMMFAAYLAYDYFVNRNFDLVMISILVLLIMMQLSNYFIKSSMHTAFNVFASALFFVLNPVIGIIWLLIAFVVGLTRIMLNRHSPKEVIAGFSIATVVSFIYLYANFGQFLN